MAPAFIDDTLVKLVGTSVDITQRKAAEEKIKASRLRRRCS
jgi:hypothetical protein